MKRLKLNTKLNMLANGETLKIFPISLVYYNFSKRIASKYNIFRSSINLPALIFLRLFGMGGVNKITNINRMESINNYFRLYFNLYFNTISRLERMISQYNQLQKYLYPVGYIKVRSQKEASILSNYASYFKNIFQRDLYVKKGDMVLKNDKSERSTMTYKGMLQMIQLLNQISQSLSNVALRSVAPIQSLHRSVLNSTIPSILKGGERRLFGRQGAIFSNGMPSRYYDYGIRGDFSPFSSNEYFYFHKSKKIEQEVEEIKKIVVETKTAVGETSLSNHFQKDMDKSIKQYLDINRISDQVYQNIERRIRMERERRGLCNSDSRP